MYKYFAGELYKSTSLFTCIYSLRLLFTKWFVFLPRICSGLGVFGPAFGCFGLVMALPFQDLRQGCSVPLPCPIQSWVRVSSGCLQGKAGHNAGEASAPSTSTGLVDALC